MPTSNWKRFLTEYSLELMSCTQYLDWAAVPQPARDSKWLGFPPATNEQISAAEKSLGIQLPDDLRNFYRVTNGWMLCGHSIYDIRPVENLCWLSEGAPKLWSLCKVDEDPPENDEDELELWYDQGVKVRRSIILNTRGDDSSLLFDTETDIPKNECRFGTWAAWNPAMEWSAKTFTEFFRQSRENLPQIDG